LIKAKNSMASRIKILEASLVLEMVFSNTNIWKDNVQQLIVFIYVTHGNPLIPGQINIPLYKFVNK